MSKDTDHESFNESISENEITPETKNETIGKLVKRSNFLGQMVSISTMNNKAFEILPYTNSNVFIEKFAKNNLDIHVNLFSECKCIFIPNEPIKVKVQAKRRNRRHFLNQFNYLIKITHGNFVWKVDREYKELKEVHKALTILVKKDLGKSCSEIDENDIKPEWPMFPCEKDFNIEESRISERCVGPFKSEVFCINSEKKGI